MKEITLNVPQGIGDIFWIYQKFAPHVDQIRLNVMYFGAGDYNIQTRALDFVRLFPKVSSAEPLGVDQARYERVWRSYFPMRNIFDRAATDPRKAPSFDYGCNRKLEQGVRLEQIDPKYAVEETVPLPTEDVRLPAGNFVTVYVPGAVTNSWAIEMGMWPVGHWAELVLSLYRKLRIDYPVLAIGAKYDERGTRELADRIRKGGLEVDTCIDESPSVVIQILRRTTFFVGHQSGLNVLADNLDTRQIMLYMATLKGLMYSWPKRRNITKKLFTAGLLSETPDGIVRKVEWGTKVKK